MPVWRRLQQFRYAKTTQDTPPKKLVWREESDDENDDEDDNDFDNGKTTVNTMPDHIKPIGAPVVTTTLVVEITTVTPSLLATIKPSAPSRQSPTLVLAPPGVTVAPAIQPESLSMVMMSYRSKLKEASAMPTKEYDNDDEVYSNTSISFLTLTLKAFKNDSICTIIQHQHPCISDRLRDSSDNIPVAALTTKRKRSFRRDRALIDRCLFHRYA
jgi:hypothetical protein